MGKLWCLTIKYDMTIDKNLFKIDYDVNVNVTALKKKIKEEMKPNLNDFVTNLFIV